MFLSKAKNTNRIGHNFLELLVLSALQLFTCFGFRTVFHLSVIFSSHLNYEFRTAVYYCCLYLNTCLLSVQTIFMNLNLRRLNIKSSKFHSLVFGIPFRSTDYHSSI